jgi:hypothetical protein
MDAKAAFKKAHSLFRYWRSERSCCPDQIYLSSDESLFVRAAGRHGIDAGLTERIVQSCITDHADRLLLLNEHLTGCIGAGLAVS